MKTSKIQNVLRSLIVMMAILAISFTYVTPAAAGSIRSTIPSNTGSVPASTPEPRPPFETPNVSWNG